MEIIPAPEEKLTELFKLYNQIDATRHRLFKGAWLQQSIPPIWIKSPGSP